MKKLLFPVFFLSALFLTSCEKEEAPVTPVTSSNQPRNVQIDYKIYAVSGDFKMTCLQPNAEKNALELVTTNFNRYELTISFQYTSGNKFMIEAQNSNPSPDEVTVELYVDGKLITSSNANAPGAVAKAEGFVN